MSGTFEQRRRLALELLRDAGGRPVSYSDLKAAGIEQPAAVIYELELAGHSISHRLGGVALRAPGDADESALAAVRRHRRRR